LTENKDVDQLPTAEGISRIRDGRHIITLPNLKQVSVLEWRNAPGATREQIKRRQSALSTTLTRETHCRQCDQQNKHELFHTLDNA